MKKKRSIKIGLAIGIVILFIVSAIAPLTTGLDTEKVEVKVDIELERMLDNLRFMCTSPDGFNSVKYEHYKEKILSQYSSDISYNGVVIESEKKVITTPDNPMLSPIASDSGPLDSPWSMLCHDLHHTSQSPYSTEDNPYIEKWRFYSNGWVDETPVIDNNGTIYFSGEYNVLDHLFAIYPDGTEKWKYKIGGIILGSSPAIAQDGTIYIGSWDTGLYAINPDGAKKWRVGTGGSIFSSPAIGEDGTIYVGTTSTGNSLVAVNPNGTIKWLYKTGDSIWSAPCIGDDGTIYIGSDDTYLYAMNPNGTLRWRFKTGEFIKAPPSIADDGTIYIGSYDDYLYALYPNNGTMKWKCKIGHGTALNPSIASDGTIYCGWDRLYAVYPNGTIKWSFNMGNERHIDGSSPAISAEGTIYFGTNIGDSGGGEIIAVNPDGTEKWRKKIAKKWVESSPSIAEDGTIYIGSSVSMNRGYLHAFGNIESNQPPGAPVIDGPSQVGVGEMNWFTFRAVDPDRNPIQLYIDWGDGNSGWTGDEYASDELMWQEYAWDKPGSYSIKAKVKDMMGEESDWDYFEVIVPRNKAINTPILNFFQSHPDLFPLLQKLIQNLGL